MSIEIITILLFASMIVLLLSGLPIAFGLGGLSVLFLLALWGINGIGVVSSVALGTMHSLILTAIPLFIFMALMLQSSGVADNLYRTMHLWFSGIRGGLAMGTVGICTLFAAMSGIAATGTVTMGLIALPAMLARNYDKKIATGCIMAGGALGPLIPPSVTMIVYGLFAEESVGRLFAAGVFPGLLLSTLFIAYIGIRCFFQPSLGPALPPEERGTWKDRFISLKGITLPIFLILGVLGAIFSGLATPTEAAAIGAILSVAVAVINRQFNLKNFQHVCLRTLKLTAMAMFIIIGAKAFSNVYTGIGALDLIKNLVIGMPGGIWGALIVMSISWFILGCFMDGMAILMITGPVYIPIAQAAGIDMVWFGILFMLNMEMAFITPPFGFNLFFMKAVAPKNITIRDIYSSVLPFLLLQLTGLVIVFIFPQIALWLPNLMFSK